MTTLALNELNRFYIMQISSASMVRCRSFISRSLIMRSENVAVGVRTLFFRRKFFFGYWFACEYVLSCQILHCCFALYMLLSLHKKWSFPLRISSVNVNNSAADLVTFTEEILNVKLCFLAVFSIKYFVVGYSLNSVLDGCS